MLSAKMEDYLKAIYDLQRTSDGPVATSAIADHLDVTPPTATSMMETLEEQGLVDREKYKGVVLTRDGETVALEVIRHHRLLECFLSEQLGYSRAEVHDEADRLEHHISEAFEERVADVLGDPEVDPHGDPIPRDSLDPVEEDVGETLGSHAEGDRLVVRRVRDRDAAELEYLEEHGITPGTTLTVAEVAPIGMVTVTVEDGRAVSLPADLADSIRVDVLEDEGEESHQTA